MSATNQNYTPAFMVSTKGFKSQYDWAELLKPRPQRMTVAQYANAKGVSTRTVYRWLRDDLIPAKRRPNGTWVLMSNTLTPKEAAREAKKNAA